FGKILSELLLIIKYFYFAIIMDLYKNKFRIKSSRLKDWDYSTPWWYYVTICTKDMKCRFGEIRNGKMIYNQIGKKAVEYFENIPKHFLSSEIDYFIVMPNHVHGIIIINDTVETRHGVSLQTNFGKLIKNSLSVIINHYKGAVTRFTRKSIDITFQWQRGFYDHIIRNENDLDRIRTYISNNPLKWELDEYFKLNK
ncbi:MAG TPA: transposase, partial [Ignavibacteriaceae bacterium]